MTQAVPDHTPATLVVRKNVIDVPPLRAGQWAVYQDQAYRYEGIVAYKPASSPELVPLLVFSTYCPNCGSAFVVQSSARAGGLTRRCESCRAAKRGSVVRLAASIPPRAPPPRCDVRGLRRVAYFPDLRFKAA